MARFSLRRPSELLARVRQKSSENTATISTTHTTDDHPHDPSATPPHAISSPPSKAIKQKVQQVRRSASLSRLREKLTTHQLQQDDPDIPPVPGTIPQEDVVPVTETLQLDGSEEQAHSDSELVTAATTPNTEDIPTVTTSATTLATNIVSPSRSPRRTASDTAGSEKSKALVGLQLATPFQSRNGSVEVDEPRSSTEEEQGHHDTIALTVQAPTPDIEKTLNLEEAPYGFDEQNDQVQTTQQVAGTASHADTDHSYAADQQHTNRPPAVRKQSLVNQLNANLVPTLLESPARPRAQPSASDSILPTADYFATATGGIQHLTNIMSRKIWVRRPNGSATLVQIREDDLVDDVRDMILKKYANSLGRTFDAPDMTLRILSRVEHGQGRNERVLGPEEEICRTLDSYYPGGQNVDEALVIDVPKRHTPKPSPRPHPIQYHQHSYSGMEDYRPAESDQDYFPPMPIVIPASVPQTTGSHESRGSVHHQQPVVDGHSLRAMSVVNTGQVPPLPSPGTINRRHREQGGGRPKYARQHTSSPTIVQHPNLNAPGMPLPPTSQAQQLQHPAHRQGGTGRQRLDSNASERPNGNMMGGQGLAPAPPPLPTPPAPDAPSNKGGSNPPTPNGVVAKNVAPSQRDRIRRNRRLSADKPSSRSRQSPRPTSDNTNPYASILDGSVPPINVLIVEDNIINLRILEGLMKRLKVRWQTAMNGQIAVDKWRGGGYHLVLMDIQMPVMNGLQATKEIRRLERVNSIGVFTSSAVTSPDEIKTNGTTNGVDHATAKEEKHNPEDDKLQLAEGLFKSPVIIVALTASSLQSDRHEALAAGCNDFLTKPVNFVWLERKVKEWGCMQALIDFDGWRKWKDYAAKEEEGKTDEQKEKDRIDDEKQKKRAEKMAILQEKQRKRAEEEKAKKEADKKKRESTDPGEPVDLDLKRAESGTA